MLVDIYEVSTPNAFQAIRDLNKPSSSVFKTVHKLTKANILHEGDVHASLRHHFLALVAATVVAVLAVGAVVAVLGASDFKIIVILQRREQRLASSLLEDHEDNEHAAQNQRKSTAGNACICSVAQGGTCRRAAFLRKECGSRCHSKASESELVASASVLVAAVHHEVWLRRMSGTACDGSKHTIASGIEDTCQTIKS